MCVYFIMDWHHSYLSFGEMLESKLKSSIYLFIAVLLKIFNLINKKKKLQKCQENASYTNVDLDMHPRKMSPKMI